MINPQHRLLIDTNALLTRELLDALPVGATIRYISGQVIVDRTQTSLDVWMPDNDEVGCRTRDLTPGLWRLISAPDMPQPEEPEVTTVPALKVGDTVGTVEALLSLPHKTKLTIFTVDHWFRSGSDDKPLGLLHHDPYPLAEEDVAAYVKDAVITSLPEPALQSTEVPDAEVLGHEERPEAHQAAWDLITAWTDDDIDSSEALRRARALIHPVTEEEVTLTVVVRIDLPTKELDTLLSEYVTPVVSEGDYLYVQGLPTYVRVKTLATYMLSTDAETGPVQAWANLSREEQINIATYAVAARSGDIDGEWTVESVEYGDALNDSPF